MQIDPETDEQNGERTWVIILCAHEMMRDLLAYWLGSVPAHIFVAQDGYEANRLLRTISAGVLVTDRALPPWPGLDPFRQILARNPRLGVAVIEDSAPESATLARCTGATIVLQRPLTRRSVMDALGLPAA